MFRKPLSCNNSAEMCPVGGIDFGLGYCNSTNDRPTSSTLQWESCATSWHGGGKDVERLEIYRVASVRWPRNREGRAGRAQRILRGK